MSWAVLSILSAFLWACGNIIDKVILTRWSIRPILPVLMIGIVDLIVSASIFIFHDVPLLPVPLLLLAFLAGCCYFFMLYLYFYAVKWEDVSSVIPLLYLTPLWIALIAHFFLGETLGLLQYAGTGLLIIGSILISIRTLKVPLVSKSLLGVVLACFCFAINQVITKYLLEHADTLSIFAYIRAGSFLAMFPLLLMNFKLFPQLNERSGLFPISLMMSNAGLNLIALFIFMTAASVGYITLVNALVAVQPLFVLLFVILLSQFYPLLLKEELEKEVWLKKIFSIVIMFIGVILVQ